MSVSSISSPPNVYSPVRPLAAHRLPARAGSRKLLADADDNLDPGVASVRKTRRDTGDGQGRTQLGAITPSPLTDALGER